MKPKTSAQVAAYGIREFFARVKNATKEAAKKFARKVKQAANESANKFAAKAKEYGKQLKTALKDSAKIAYKNGKEHLESKLHDIVKDLFKEVAGSIAVGEKDTPLNQTYTNFGENLEILGKAMEQEGLQMSVGVPLNSEDTSS